jgi:DivIVA domain-containing protein
MWLWVLGIVVVVGAVTVVGVGAGGSLGEVYEDRPDRTVPVGRPLAADDLRDVTFSTAVRGYRMDEVDALLERIRADLLAREARAQPANGATAADAEPARGADAQPAGGATAADAAQQPAPTEPETATDTSPSQDG